MLTPQSFNQRIAIILVEPQHSGNIGSAARAMNNMGLTDLRIVRPQSFDPMRASWLSPGCEEIFRTARFTNTLTDALDGVQRVVASTARHRRDRQPVVTPRELAGQICEPDNVARTAILFGREDSGLPKDAIQLCDSIVQIPTAAHASLNLAQAVMVICHNLFEGFLANSEYETGRRIVGRQGVVPTAHLNRKSSRDVLADWQQMEHVVGAIVELMSQTDYFKHTAEERAALSARRLLQQATPTHKQLDILRGMIRSVEQAIQRDASNS